MIEPDASPDPSGYRASVAYEEAGLPYSVHSIDLPSGARALPSSTVAIGS